jgi:hypothetical protein
MVVIGSYAALQGQADEGRAGETTDDEVRMMGWKKKAGNTSPAHRRLGRVTTAATASTVPHTRGAAS